MKPTEIKKPYRMEEFLRPQMFQEVAQMVHFQWRRNPVDNSMVNASMVPFCLSALLNVLFFGCNGWDIIGHLCLGRPANQNPPVLSITIYFSIRGLMLFRNFWQRYRFIRIYSHVGGPMFCVVPLALFLLTHEGKDTPVAQHEQLLGGWLPFGVRKDPNFYLLVWFIDLMCTTCGVSFFITFDNLFNVMQGHLVMHLGHLARQFSSIDPRQSLTDEKRFFADLRLLVQRQQQYRRYNDIFKVAFLVSNFVGAGSLCFYLFMLSETSDVLIIAQYILPTLVLVGFTFEICLRGTQLEAASEGLESSLRSQEWYLGSRRYRKFYLLWTQYCQRTQKLGAFGLIQVNMVHFKIMQLAYRLFTFLKSH